MISVFFFKQKTAYEMRISDWSSDVCSSDLSNIAVARIIWLGKHADATPGFLKIPLRIRDPHGLAALACIVTYTPGTVWSDYSEAEPLLTLHVLDLKDAAEWFHTIQRSEERRAGTEWVNTGKSRGAPG